MVGVATLSERFALATPFDCLRFHRFVGCKYSKAHTLFSDGYETDPMGQSGAHVPNRYPLPLLAAWAIFAASFVWRAANSSGVME